MSHKYPEERSGEVDDECSVAPVSQRTRQNNSSVPGEPPLRRPWRPCQMLSPDGELNPHHHHHHQTHHHHHHHQPAGRGGPHRQRRRPPSDQAQGQSQANFPSSASEPILSSESQATKPRPVPQLRPAVTRYRRRGDPNPRLKGQRQKPLNKEIQESKESALAEHREGHGEIRNQQKNTEPLQDRTSSPQTPVASINTTDHSPGPASHDLQLEIQENDVVCKENMKEVMENKEHGPVGHLEDHYSAKDHSCCAHDDMQAVQDGSEVCAAKEVENHEEELDVLEVEAQGSEITDLCSDTESAASLSNDGPLHSPPPLQSPTPPSSPDTPLFPHLDHFGEETSMSPLPDNDMLPEDEDDCAESTLEYYPKTYADFYTESHQKSFVEPVENSETKSHPKSFPEPLKTSYSEALRDTCMQSHQKSEPNETQQGFHHKPFTSHRQEDFQKSSPMKGPHHVPKRGKDRGYHPSQVDSSVGCRLHHYDGQSDGEGGSANQSPIQKSLRHVPRQADAQTKNSSSVQRVLEETKDEVCLSAEECTKVPGDAISLVIKDIREAIEEVKTKTIRSPYTPDQPVEPIWVMRQEISPIEEVDPLQMMTGHSISRSPSQHGSVSDQESGSPLNIESSRSLHSQQYQEHQSEGRHMRGDAITQPQLYVQPNQTQPQHPPQQPRHQVQPAPQQPPVQEIRRSLPSFPTFVDVPGPCDPDDLIDGIIFAATYLGCTHLLSERTPTKSARMQQAQEAMNRVQAAQKQAKNRKNSPDSESAPCTAEVDLFMSTQRIKVLNADTQESLMDLPLRTISYIADIGNMVVLMARGKMVRSRSAQENLEHTAEQTTMSNDDRRLYRMICHVFESEDAQLIAQSIGQSFSVAYQEFLRANGIDPEDLSQREYSDLLNTQDMYNDDLIHFSKSENCRDVYIEKQKGEILGVVIVESGWGSILPTVIIASMMHAGPAEKSGRLNIGDQIMTVNGTSLVGLPLSTCQSIIKGLKSQCRIKMNIVRCPPVTMVLIRRPDLRYQLGFSVQNGIICSLMRGGIAERGGVRVGHRIIEINGQSVVATPHERIVQILSNAMGEIHMKTMPAAMYRLLTAQEQPVYL
ncbi:amyloid-beta A4 precursor protein-binding family A member 1-like [Corythoichthys intestinalis]|uniref:amyloid-beta A4 precursor protein-binding family A member 1-like n=1 Tax=Corythoichthys intestinalis TaxID=161448 RepID=UPI0025A56B62|nr:amyloid-beta A4 precursor protein-binding family A member 1-like [Corythoichthys intestinalis]XP_057675596.1 amyloid-beta A4 precursor protein-binding family A member 1-like [Corythoichthys intestinalis]